MVFNRWWHAAVAAAALVQVTVLLLPGLPPARLAFGLAVVAVFLVAWVLLSGRAADGNPPAIALTVVMIAVAGTGTAITPGFAIIQFIGFPLMWTLNSRLLTAVIANVALALAVGVGFLISRRLDSDALLEIGLTVLFSLMFSLAFGLWITYYATQSEARQVLLDVLTTTQDQLAAVSRDAGVVAERERLAREIHDTIAQDLTGMVMLAQRARQETDASVRATQLAQLEETAREALTETRALVADGAPASLDAGLVAALDRLTDRFSQETGIMVTLATDDEGLDRPTEVVVLRCTQEALSNVRKHSAATTATVTLEHGTLIITDNGHGFDPEVSTTGYGLSGMRDRLALVGGRIDVASGASGTTLTISLAEVHA